MKLSGGFHSSIQLKKLNTDFQFMSKLGYVNKYVIPKYDNIYGLNPKRNKKFLKDVFKPEYTKKIKQHLQIL